MQKDFDNLADLLEEVRQDMNADGANAGAFNRYPVRFVLFDNFRDSNEFVYALINMGVTKMQEIVKWLEGEELMLTYSELAERMKAYIRENDTESCIVIPFSELARFYDNERGREFDALVTEIKGIEATPRGHSRRQRVYVPMIGQLGKMAKYADDTQSVIWHCKPTAGEENYHVILAHSTYGVRGLEESFSLVPSLKVWLKMWRDEEAKPRIISTSRTLFAFARYAQPDNAFTYTVCHNAYEFLTKGLHLDFGDIVYREEDASNWETLAANVDCRNFSFGDFFNEHFQIHDLSNAAVFVKTWFAHTGHFERWLLSTYYIKRFGAGGYIGQTLREAKPYSNQDFVTEAVLGIFSSETPEAHLPERTVVLEAAERQRVRILEAAEQMLRQKLENIATEQGSEAALHYMTGLTTAEKELLIRWVGAGRIAVGKVESIYPSLYHYLGKSFGVSDAGKKWLLGYFDAYKQAKVANRYTDEVRSAIAKHNADAVAFDRWYNMFKTVRTELSALTDIDVFYWIDGLGVDWLPFIKWQIDRHRGENVFLHDLRIARAQLPTTTERNKSELQLLAGDSLSKKGDLDGFAHRCTPHPRYLIEEMEIVAQAIADIVHEHAGQKVAIVSDHGLSYLSQLCEGLNLGGIKPDHHGRLATCTGGKLTDDSKYVKLGDGTTICALRHESLGAKIPAGQGCHGGCTPEEVLVPILILSSQPKSAEYTITLIDNEVQGTDPRLTFRIKGVTALDPPKLFYAGLPYDLNHEGGDRYVSDRLALQQDVTEAEVRIGTYKQTFKLQLNLGAEEEDLFGDL